MNVLIDAGNSFVKLAALDDQGNITRLSVEQFMQSTSLIKQVTYCSVNDSPDLKKILIHCTQNNIPTSQVTVVNKFKEIQCGYDIVKNLGVDRWVALVGARLTNFEHNLIVVDAGTAITIDVCSDNQHVGGWIAPGLKLMQDAIIGKASGVFTETSINKEVFGTNTPSALFHGCLFSLVGMIEKAFELTQKLNSKETKIIITGGDAELISDYLPHTVCINKDLVFIGLKEFLK